MSLGILLLGLIALLPLFIEMKRQGKIQVNKPDKRRYIFEDEDGNRDNPFSGEDTVNDKSDWKYDVN